MTHSPLLSLRLAQAYLAWVHRHADPATREGQRRIADAEREVRAAEMEVFGEEEKEAA